MHRFGALLAIVCVSIVGLGGNAVAQECGFSWVNSLPPRVDLHRVTENVGLYVAVGDGGTIVTSEDGDLWDYPDSKTTQDLFGVDWGEGFFVAVGDGVVVNSRDGVDWTVVAERPGVVFNDVDYGDGRFVAVASGFQGSVLISENGLNWENHNAGWEEIGQSIVWTGTAFLASGEQDIFASDNGLDWELVGFVPSSKAAADSVWNRVDLAWDGGRLFWAGGLEVFWSEDGSEWEFGAELDGCGDYSSILGISAARGAVMVTGVTACPDPFINPNSIIMVSRDQGSAWTTEFLQRGGGLTSVCDGRRGLVAVGALGEVARGSDAVTWSCPDGGCSSAACSDALYDVTIEAETALAVGGVGPCDDPEKRFLGGTVVELNDDGEWVPHEILTAPLRAVASNGRLYAGVGDSLTATSSNGVNWTEGPYLEHPVDFASLAWGAGVFVAVGNEGNIYISTGGRNWAKQYSYVDEDLAAIHWNGNLFVVVGAGGVVLSSRDGSNWTVDERVGSEDLAGVDYDGEVYLVVGSDGGLWTSTDVHTWERGYAGTRGELRDIAYGDGLYAVVGAAREAEGFVALSQDRQHWTILPAPSDELRRVAWSGEEFIAVGDGRSLISSRCPGLLITLDPPASEVLWAEDMELTVHLSSAAEDDLVLDLESSDPAAASVDDEIVIPAGATTATFLVRGHIVADRVRIRAVLPADLGGAAGVAEVAVVPELPAPRRLQGRHRVP